MSDPKLLPDAVVIGELDELEGGDWVFETGAVPPAPAPAPASAAPAGGDLLDELDELLELFW